MNNVEKLLIKLCGKCEMICEKSCEKIRNDVGLCCGVGKNDSFTLSFTNVFRMFYTLIFISFSLFLNSFAHFPHSLLLLLQIINKEDIIIYKEAIWR